MTLGRWFTGGLSVLAILIVAKGYHGWHQARSDAPELISEAAALIADGRGASDLGDGRLVQLLAIHDPNFFKHNGIDLQNRGPRTRGTVTQALARPVAAPSVVPGASQIMRLTYAMALDERLPKTAQIALFLDRVDMGEGPDGHVITGFFDAAHKMYGRTPSGLSDQEFLTLVAVMHDPSALPLTASTDEMQTRVVRLGAILSSN